MMLPIIAPLFVPGNRPERFSKALAAGASAVIYDLEDAVRMEDKDFARKAVVERPKADAIEIVRVNSASSGMLDLDLRAIAANPPSAVMLAKAERAEDLQKIVSALGLQIQLIPLIETALGLIMLPGILTAGNVYCAAFGSIDFALDIGCEHERLSLLSARSEMVLQSRRANCKAPIDGVTASVEDDALIRDDALHARTMGFGGKLAIHPRQIGPILSSFSVSDADLAWAERVLDASIDGNAQKFEGLMIDRPLIEKARSIVERAKCGRSRLWAVT
jgi:citrate lyase subunit beta/citryl-CoA lyase